MIPSVASAQYTPVVLLLSDSTVPPGASVAFTVNGCEPGVVVTMSVDDTAISTDVTCQTSAAATFRRVPQAILLGTATGTVNAPTTPGTYVARATTVISGEAETATAVLTVEGAATTTTVPTGALPSTGSDVWRISASATAVLGIGFAAVLMSRRRRQPTA